MHTVKIPKTKFLDSISKVLQWERTTALTAITQVRTYKNRIRAMQIWF